jgi:hypothetical protein
MKDEGFGGARNPSRLVEHRSQGMQSIDWPRSTWTLLEKPVRALPAGKASIST